MEKLAAPFNVLMAKSSMYSPETEEREKRESDAEHACRYSKDLLYVPLFWSKNIDATHLTIEAAESAWYVAHC